MKRSEKTARAKAQFSIGDRVVWSQRAGDHRYRVLRTGTVVCTSVRFTIRDWSDGRYIDANPRQTRALG